MGVAVPWPPPASQQLVRPGVAGPASVAQTEAAMRDPNDILVPNLNPAAIPGPSRDIYALMGRDNIYRMIEAFYRELGSSPIRAMFPADLVESSHKSAAFFVQLLGGPQEYNQRFGAPRMRARHIPFRITASARNVWLDCFERVLARAVEDYGFPAQHLTSFRGFLEGFSLWMVNAQDEPLASSLASRAGSSER